jgi:DNA-directed RNA polymerase specialized sigma24 family protein
MTIAARTSPFAPTRWTLVRRASGDTPESRAALSELCEAYYQAVFRFLRREGRTDDAARELTQEFFSRILKRSDLNADPDRGPFRTYLLGAVKHFLADQRKAANREKRGGGEEDERLDADAGAGQGVVPPGQAPTSDTWFDRQWALTVMERGLLNVEEEFEAAGKVKQFAVLKHWLGGDTGQLSQADAARQLNWTETAVKVAVHRLRRRFRETIRAEIAQTVVEGTDVEAELRYLIEVLAEE